MIFSSCWAHEYLYKHKQEGHVRLQVELWVVLDLVMGGT